MSTIVQSYDASNNAVYPVTHLRAVRDSSGTTLESMMQDVREMAVGYYECSTPGSTAAKTITTDSSVSLSTKILCKVKFVEKNTTNNTTMNINGTGAKALYYNGVRAAANNSWYPNEVVDLYYDGTNYQAKSCADTLEYDVSLHQTHEITEITTTTRTLVFNGDVVSSWESETSISDSSVEGYKRFETNTGQDIDSTTVYGPNTTYDSSANQTNVVYVTTHTYRHVVNNYTFEEAVKAVPMSYRHGGLKLRFISNSDSSISGNKYVQYRLMKNTWSTIVSDWQGVDDEPTTGSENLVKSGGVADSINQLKNAGYLYAGIATPTTNPGIPEGHVFYIANGKGTYTNFGGIEVTEDDVVILYYDTVWYKKATGIASQKKLYRLEDEIGIINCNRLEGYDYTSRFTLQTAIAAVPLNKRYAAKGITYLDEIGEIHFALFSSDSYGSGWLNINKWILLDREFIDFVYNRTFFSPVLTRGYIDFDNNQGKLIVSSTLYYTVGKLLKSINAGSYDMDIAETLNFSVLVIDSDSKLAFKGINIIDKTDIVIASFVKSGNTIDNICHSVVPYRINGVDIINDNYIKLNDNYIKLSEQVSEFDNKLENTGIIATKAIKSNVVQSVAGSSYFNTVEYNARKGDIISISLNGSDGLINSGGLLVVDGKVQLGGIRVGQNIIVELPNDITYVQFQKGASGVIGSGDIELVIDMPFSIDNRIENNSRKIEELELKNTVSADIQSAASAYEFYIRAREEYLRNLYKSSGEKAHWYGVEWIEKRGNDGIAINSDGDESLHSTLPIQNKMKRCVKTDIVQYYLNADNSDLKEDGTPAKLYGVDGNVMVEIPEFFYREEEEIVDGERKIRLKISEQGLDGFIFSPKRYTSAYEATLDRTNNKLVSVCTTLFERNTEEILTEETNFIVGTAISRGTHKTARRSGFTENASNYRGGTNDATLDNETDPTSQNYSRNQLGLPIANVNRTQCRSYVDNLNGEFIYQYDTHKVLWMLAMVEFKKKDITKGTNMSIGANVYPDYNSYEAYFSPQGGISCLPCGITNSLGNKTGTVYYRMINVPVKSTGVSSSIVYNRWADVWMPCLSYRGVEHWFGHIYKIADGINILCEGTGTYYEGKEGNSNYEYNDVTYWYQKNPYLTNDRGTDKQKLGTFRYMSGTLEIKSILGGSKMHILPIDSDVTDYQTHYCDCVEIYHRGGMMYPTFNGRIVSGLFDGANFIVGNNLADNGSPRASDGTRLDNL